MDEGKTPRAREDPNNPPHLVEKHRETKCLLWGGQVTEEPGERDRQLVAIK